MRQVSQVFLGVIGARLEGPWAKTPSRKRLEGNARILKAPVPPDRQGQVRPQMDFYLVNIAANRKHICSIFRLQIAQRLLQFKFFGIDHMLSSILPSIRAKN